MILFSISEHLKSRFEGYIPQAASYTTIALTGAVTAYQLYQRSTPGTFLAAAVFAATTCLRLREWITLTNVIDRLEQLDRDWRASFQKGDFVAKKTLFINRYNAIRDVFAANPNQNRYPALLWEKAIKQLKEIHRILKGGKPLPGVFSLEAVNSVTFRFLGPLEAALTTRVSVAWKHSADSHAHWKEKCYNLMNRPFVPDPDLVPTDYRQQFKDLYTKIFGREFYQSYYGLDIGPVPPIPTQLLQRADAIIFIPEYFTMTLLENSPLGLDQNGKLTENPNEYHNRPLAIDGKRVLQVPVTLNNLDILTRRHLKKGAPTGIDPNSSANDLRLQGNAHFAPHWSGQKRELIGKGLSYPQQQALAQQAGLQVVPLLDRVLFNLFAHLRSGKFVDRASGIYDIARTATTLLGANNNPHQAVVTCLDHSDGLAIYYGSGHAVGAAVEVPS